MAQRDGPDPWLFDLWSRFYDLPLVQRLTYRPEHDAVLARLRRLPHGRVLDLGCGTGILAARIRREIPRADLVGCDFSRGMLAEAAREGRARALVQATALALPFGADQFDAVVSTEAFHWFPDQPAALREIFRVLAPKGSLLVSLVNPPLEMMSRAGHEISRLLGEPARWPTRGQLRRLLRHAGFEIESQNLVLRVPGTLLLPSVLTVARRPS
jgi:ubiquinone/menaquinone biosynthesis C-methylase UbiE